MARHMGPTRAPQVWWLIVEPCGPPFLSRTVPVPGTLTFETTVAVVLSR